MEAKLETGSAVPEPRPQSIAKSSAAVSLCTALSYAVSFLSQVVIAGLFGASAQLDSYLTAAALPFTITGTMNAAVSYVMIPRLTEQNGSSEELGGTVSTFFLLVAVSAPFVALVGVSLSETIVRGTAPSLAPAKQLLAVSLQNILWVAVAFSLLTSFYLAFHQFKRRFVLPAATTALPPMCTILGGLLLSSKLGIASIALGYAGGIGLQCLILMVSSDFRLRINFKGLKFSGEGILASLFAVQVSMLPYTLPPVMDAYWASRLPDGSLSYIGYAYRIVVALGAISFHGLAVVLFPFMSEDASRADMQSFRRRVGSALMVILLATLPAAGLLTALRYPILTVLFQRGNFDGTATAGVAAVLPWYLLGMVGMVSKPILDRCFYATRALRTVALLGLPYLIFYFSLSGLLSAEFSHVGIAVVFAIYWNLQYLHATLLLRRRVGALWDGERLRVVLKVGAASGAAGLGVSLGYALIGTRLGPIPLVLLLGLAGVFFLIVAAKHMFSSDESRILGSYFSLLRTKF